MSPSTRAAASRPAVQVTEQDAALAERMTFHAAMGHACGIHFKAAGHMRQHPEFAWQKGLLRDLDAQPWTEFRTAK